MNSMSFFVLSHSLYIVLYIVTERSQRSGKTGTGDNVQCASNTRSGSRPVNSVGGSLSWPLWAVWVIFTSPAISLSKWHCCQRLPRQILLRPRINSYSFLWSILELNHLHGQFIDHSKFSALPRARADVRITAPLVKQKITFDSIVVFFRQYINCKLLD